MKIKEFTKAKEALHDMTETLIEMMSGKEVFNLAVSGGSTAKRMFRFWTSEYATAIDWERIQFYWVDERCVEPYEEESNFCYARRLLFDPLIISPAQVHRIKGEADPVEEAARYSSLVNTNLPWVNDIPHFDAMILGVGSDGHTASLFPGDRDSMTTSAPYTTSEHPINHQKRITVTPNVILNDTPLLVPVFGTDKANIICGIKEPISENLDIPAAYILNKAKNATIYYSAD